MLSLCLQQKTLTAFTSSASSTVYRTARNKLQLITLGKRACLEFKINCISGEPNHAVSHPTGAYYPGVTRRSTFSWSGTAR